MEDAVVLERAAAALHVRGLIQGVGFRPFVHRLARRYDLSGWVRNTAGDVEIVLEGAPEAIDAFAGSLNAEAPPLARITGIDRVRLAVEGREGFEILDSLDDPARRQPVSPDVATCPACVTELFDPADRRYRYPFITCTDCGPRFTIIAAMPYDRERTSMREFRQCARCRREYLTAGDRRFHSETNSCPACGPRLWFSRSQGQGRQGSDGPALEAAARLLDQGEILALKGLGGFHLAVRADCDAAVRRLRARKHRDAKPLAIMVRTLAHARAIATLHPEQERLLSGPERPIVLVPRREDAGVAPSVAPGLAELGLMLAYTPLHHLLLDLVQSPLVMTSGNQSDEPIAIGNAEALDALGGIADGFLLHDREILERYDDSLLRVVDGAPVFLRRARGYAPLPLALPVPSPQPLVAVGPHLKNTFTLVHGAQAYVSQHIGDLEALETLEHFQHSLDAARRLFRISPEVAVRDWHPGYLSTRLAEELGLERVVAVQHHHAHVAAVLAEHGRTEPCIGLAYDGTGYGDDGHIWGGEVLVADLRGYRRAAHLAYVPLPGGDLGARNPWRAALGYLSLQPAAARAFSRAFDDVDARLRARAEEQIARRINTPMVSSMGRLFDAAAAVLGVRRTGSYEGQAAMELEALAGCRVAAEYRCRIEREGDAWVLDPLPLLITLGVKLQRGEPVHDLAADFHASIAWASMNLVLRVAEDTGLRTVVLSGGVFQNARLLGSLKAQLGRIGFEVLTPRALGPNDGAVSYGQAAIAAAQLSAPSP